MTNNEHLSRNEKILRKMLGEDIELDEPQSRIEVLLTQLLGIIGGGSVSPEDIQAAIEEYLNSHDADIVTEQELSDALAGYYDKDTIDTALAGKADVANIPDVSNFIDADVDNLTNYYDKDAVDTTLNEKQDTLTAGDNISIATVNGVLTISATDTTYSDATQQTHGLMSTEDKTKLDGITAAKMQAWDVAEQNVNADWTAESGDAQILHKPDLSVYALAANVTKSALGIDNVDNTSDEDKPISTAAQTALAGKVDKEPNKSLMSADEHTKLNDIEAGAEVNVQSDWEQNNSNADDFIKNKPANLVQDASYVHTDNNFTNAEKAKADGAIQSTEKGTAGGVAELDANGKVPTSQLPAYVSDVYEGYLDIETTGKFYSDAQFQNEIQGQPNKIYVSLDTNLSYRWGGTGFREISPSIALGNTSETAYRGDWGAEDRAAIGTLGSLNTSEKSNLVAAINELQSGSVSVDPDRGLSENDFTDSLKSKLDGIESGAEVNVQSDWNQTVTTADDFIKNKPENLVQDASYVHTDNNYTTGEKTKLAGISAGAQVNVKPDWNAAAGTDAEILNKPTIPTVMAGAAANAAGAAGLVPAPAAGDNEKFLRGDGTWVRSLTIDQVYPVGSIYMSVNSTNPSALFGGTWVQLENRFLIGASDYYPAGTIGGEVEHTLSEAELPPHRHPSIFNFSGSGDFFATVGAGTASDDSTSGYGGYAGGGQAHNNMPPFLAVYMWKRTA